MLEDEELSHIVVLFSEQVSRIFERRRNLALITDVKTLNQQILESVAEGICGLDIDGKTTFVNPAAVTLLGYESNELIGKHLHSLIHHGYADGSGHPWDQCQIFDALSRDIIRYVPEDIFRRKDGTSFQVEYTATPVHKNNHVIGAVVSFTDITVRIELSRQLQQSQKMDTLGYLTGGIAHDFNNMLAGILGYTKLAQRLKHGDPTGKLGSYLMQIEQAGERASDLIEQLLIFSRGFETKKPILLNLNSAVEKDIKMIRPILPASIEIYTTLEETFPVLADPVQVQQIIMTLCVNARDAMNSKGKLTITLSAVKDCSFLCDSCLQNVTGNFSVLTVQDSGTGIPEINRKRLFEPFFSTKEVGKGSGMGLAMVHGLVHSGSGHIAIKSDIGKGSAFSIFLPAIDVKMTNELSEQVRINDNFDGGSKNILVVDDEEVVVSFMAAILETLGFNTTMRRSSLHAWTTFSAAPDQFDLVITDQTMPKMTGYELATLMLTLKPDIPIILCTGFSDVIDEETAIKSGISAYITKPIDIEHLKNILSELLAL